MHYTLPRLSPRMPKSLNSATEAHVSLVRQMQCTCNGHGQHRSNTAWLYSCFQLTCFLLLWHHQRYACTNWSLGCVRAKMEADKEKQSILELRHLTPKVDCHPWTISGPLVISNPARVSLCLKTVLEKKISRDTIKSQVCHWSLSVWKYSWTADHAWLYFFTSEDHMWLKIGIIQHSIKPSCIMQTHATMYYQLQVLYTLFSPILGDWDRYRTGALISAYRL